MGYYFFVKLYDGGEDRSTGRYWGSKPQPPKFPGCTNFMLGNLYVRPSLTGQQRNSCLERKITARNRIT